MRLRDYAKKNGICYRTAWEHYRKGLIEGSRQLSTGTIVIQEKQENVKEDFIVTYARVSSSENRDNLEKQSQRLIDFCNANGWKTHLNIKEVGSGLNEKRKKLIEVLEEGKATKIVVEHKDRLARFGVSYVELVCKHINCDLVIVNEEKGEKEDLVQDFISVITSFCARIYGQRRSKRCTEKIIKVLKSDTESFD